MGTLKYCTPGSWPSQKYTVYLASRKDGFKAFIFNHKNDIYTCVKGALNFTSIICACLSTLVLGSRNAYCAVPKTTWANKIITESSISKSQEFMLWVPNIHNIILDYTLKNKGSLLALMVPWITSKGLVHPKIKILSLITHPHVDSKPVRPSFISEHKLRYFWWHPRAL